MALLGFDKQVRVEVGESCMITLHIVNRAIVDQVSHGTSTLDHLKMCSQLSQSILDAILYGEHSRCTVEISGDLEAG